MAPCTLVISVKTYKAYVFVPSRNGMRLQDFVFEKIIEILYKSIADGHRTIQRYRVKVHALRKRAITKDIIPLLFV